MPKRGVLALKVPEGANQIFKKLVNDETSGTGTCKLEFGTIKNHYNDIRNDISDKHQKKPSKRVFLALKEPPGHVQKLLRSTD